MKTILSMLLIALVLTSCGSKDTDKPVILKDTLSCFRGSCSNHRMNCRQINYYSDKLECTMVLQQADLDAINKQAEE